MSRLRPNTLLSHCDPKGRSGRGNGVHRGSGPRWLWSRHHSTRCADIERAGVRHWLGAIRTGRAAKLAELFSLRLARGSVLYPWWHHPSACVHLTPCRRCPSTAGGLADGPIRTTNNRRQPSIGATAPHCFDASWCRRRIYSRCNRHRRRNSASTFDAYAKLGEGSSNNRSLCGFQSLELYGGAGWVMVKRSCAALPPSWWLVAVVCGGSFGSWLSVRGLPSWAIRYGLAVLLIVASGRMLVMQ
jgi:hypothetical protein